MLLDIFVTAPSLLMTTMAWYIHGALVLICLSVLFASAIGAISVYRVREAKIFVPRRPRRKLVPGA